MSTHDAGARLELSGRHRSEALISRLPSPPTDYERDLYFGPQHRWVPIFSFVSSVAVVTSFCLFMSQRLWGVVVAIPVAVNAFGSIVSLISSSRRRRYTLTEHRERVMGWTPDYIPSVDVFLPSAGEPVHLLRNTYEHVARMTWPGPLKILVLDDSDRPGVSALAGQYGFEYHVRPDRGHLKKAGNLKYGYDQSQGDMIMILDADFVPRSDFLYELMPYMDDENNGIVQSPQFFDFDQKNMTWVEHGAGATQVLFYRWIQPSRDRSNAAICVGTCALYRRKALEAAGGFAQIGHSEDVHTGVNLMRAGYGVRYVPTVVAKGSCPSDFDSFVTQQYRWATGSLSLLFSRSFHETRLTFMQRLCYWSGFLYFGGTGLNVFVAAIPPILMSIFAASHVAWTNYGLVILALAIRAYLVPIITIGRCNFVSLARIQTTYSFAHAVALWDRLRGSTDAWVATGSRSKSRTAERVGRVSRTWSLAIQIIFWPLIIFRIVEYGYTFIPLMFFAALNLLICVPIIARRDVKGFS